MKLKNNEGLKIELEETECGMVLITVDDYEYAQFQNARISDIHTENLVEWIEHTHFGNSYKSQAYISPDLMLSSFAKYDFPEENFDDFDADSHLAIIADHIY